MFWTGTASLKSIRSSSATVETVERAPLLQLSHSDDESSDGSDSDDVEAIEKTSKTSKNKKKATRRRLVSEADVDKYMSRREMTSFQEKVNAVTVLPGAFFGLLFLLSGTWLRDEALDGLEATNGNYHDGGCISSAWFPNLHALPPAPLSAVVAGIVVHCPFSFLYHWHYARRLPPGFARTKHWSRRMDQAMIHASSALVSYGTSGSLPYFALNVLYNADCMIRLFRPKVYPRRNQLRIVVAALGYTIPVLKRGNPVMFAEMWAVLVASSWLFSAYPIGGWSHSAFHIVLSLGLPLIAESAITNPSSRGQLLVAARCAFLKDHAS